MGVKGTKFAVEALCKDHDRELVAMKESVKKVNVFLVNYIMDGRSKYLTFTNLAVKNKYKNVTSKCFLFVAPSQDDKCFSGAVLFK